MMRIFVLVLLIIGAIAFSAMSYSDAAERRKPTKWQPIFGMKMQGAKGYFDANSLSTHEVDPTSKYNTGEILISYDNPTEIIVNKKKIVIRSLARSMVIECTTGLSAPVFDLYFKESMPTRETNPITGIEWPSDVKSTYTILDKKSFIYTTLCPNYI